MERHVKFREKNNKKKKIRRKRRAEYVSDEGLFLRPKNNMKERKKIKEERKGGCVEEEVQT